MRRSFASLLTGTLLGGAAACDDRPLVVVEVAPLPAGAAELYVSLSYRGHPARKPAPIRFSLRGQRLDEPATFGIRLESQTDGDLVVGAGVFDGGGCLSAFGSGTADRVSATPRLALTLGPAPVEALPPAERCQMPELTPLLLSISPVRASTAGGERAVLRGWGFGTDTCSLVSINGARATDPVCRSLVELSATVPPSSRVGPALVQVVNPSSSGDRRVLSTTLFSYYAQSIHLGPPTAYPVDAGPVALVSGRIDRDQRPDLAVVSRDAGTVTILINGGAGAFPADFRTGLPAGVRPTAVGLGDLDGDGLADLVGTSAQDDVSVHRQSQPMVPAAFSAPSHVFVNLLPSGVALGDLDGDGTLDAAVVNQLSSDVSLLLNDGHGKLVRSAAGDWQLPREPAAVELADVNGN